MQEIRKAEASKKCKLFLYVASLLGVLSFFLSLQMDESPRQALTWAGYLTALFFFVSLALGGLFFTSIQHVTNAGWSVTIRRFSESLSTFLPVGFVLTLIFIVFGADSVYEWLHPEAVAKDHLLQHKSPYLNKPFFIIRTVLFFVLWILFQRKIVGHSLKQDHTGEVCLTHRNVTLSVIFLLIFALSYSLFSVDFLMSLHAHWFSTIFGVYCFAGLFQSALAFIIILIVWLRDQIKDWVNENHFHDLGKFLFAFTIFYAYIAFSQFMLIWYANLPEETSFFLHRAHGGWMWISMSLLLFKFLVPFLALLPRGAKRCPRWLFLVACLIFVMQYVDIFWLVYPNFSEEHVVFPLWGIGMFIGCLGIFSLVVVRFLEKNPLVPLKDPRLHESLKHHI